MHKIDLCYTKENPKALDKELTLIVSKNCKSFDIDILNVEFTVNAERGQILNSNYIVDYSTGYRYFISKYEEMPNKMYKLTCAIDLYSTFADWIKQQSPVITRQEFLHSKFIIDNRVIPSTNRMINKIKVGDVGTGFNYFLTTI